MRVLVIFFCATVVWGTDFRVAPAGGDFATIQQALNVAQPGDRILVDTAVYNEQIQFPRSGVQGLPIVVEANIGQSPVLDGAGFSSGNMVTIQNRSFVVIRGFEIRNFTGVSDGSGIRILGQGTDIGVYDCEIHQILGTDAMGITVYGTSSIPLSEIVIQGNHIHHCEPARSEALTLNGNIDGFLVADNRVEDVNNIGIDFIGGEVDINPDLTLVTRNGICRGNVVIRARSSYGGGWGAGIYVDGGRNLIIENNSVSHSNLGIEIGAENKGTDTTRVIVRNNRLFMNDKVGLIFGGYDASVGRVSQSLFLGNSCYFNDTGEQGLGELFIQYAHDNYLAGNIFSAGSQNVLTYSESGNQNNVLDYNLWFSAASAATAGFVWRGVGFEGFAAFQVGSGQEAQGLWADPLFVDGASGDFHLQPGSPAINRGDPAAGADAGTTDFDGQPRIMDGRIDLGADEYPVQPCLPILVPFWGVFIKLPCGGAGILTILQIIRATIGSVPAPNEQF